MPSWHFNNAILFFLVARKSIGKSIPNVTCCCRRQKENIKYFTKTNRDVVINAIMQPQKIVNNVTVMSV